LELSILIVRQVLADEAREEPRLDEAEHGLLYGIAVLSSSQGGAVGEEQLRHVSTPLLGGDVWT